MSVNEEIAVIINKQLPKEVGDRLRERIGKIDGLEQQVEELLKFQTELKTEIDEKRVKIQHFGEQLRHHKDLDDRAIELIDRERKVELAEFRVEAAELRRKDMFSLVELVFKSPVYKQTILKSTSVPTLDQYSNTQYLSGSEMTDTENKEG